MDKLERVLEAMKGNRDALSDVIIQNKIEYYKLAYSFTLNEADALDAISEMTVILLKKITKLQQPEKFDSYSKTILVNCCRKILRQRKKVIPYTYINEALHSPHRLNDIQLDIQNAIKKLSLKQQEVLILKYYLDYDYQLIAECLNIPLGTVKSRLNVAIKRLEKELGGYYYE